MISTRVMITISRIILIIIIFLLWHLTQDAIATYKDNLQYTGCIMDQLQRVTSFINTYLNEHKPLTTLLLIITSLEVDLLTLFIFFYSIFSKSARLVIGLVILMCLRQICEVLVLLPIPPGILWYDTHFPTLFVTYGIRNDFFFSGHTALVIYAATAIGDLFKTHKYVGFLKWGLILFQSTVVILLRVHYFMDVYAAFFTAFLIYNFTQKMKLPYWLDMRSPTTAH